MNELLQGGVPLGGHVSPEILEAIFRKVSPVHDGATIVEGDRITRVGALLPLSQSEKLPRKWGTRHRAGMGLAERSDAVVVVASEERGDVTLMHDGAFRRVDSAADMLSELKTLFAPNTGAFHQVFPAIGTLAAGRRHRACRHHRCGHSLGPGTVVRMRTVPIEVTNLARDLRIQDQSAVVAQCSSVGTLGRWTLLEGTSLTARADVQSLSEGVHDVGLEIPGALPPVSRSRRYCRSESPSTSSGQGVWHEPQAGDMKMTHSRRTSFDCQLVDAYLVRLQSDIEAKWREIRCIRDEIGLLMRSRTYAVNQDGETVRTVTERLDRMLATNQSFGTLLELREAAQTLARDLDDESRK